MPRDDAETAALGADAAQAATEQTADAIDRAAEKNDDPAVAEVLDEAASHAEKAVTRVGWLGHLIRRLTGRSDPS